VDRGRRCSQDTDGSQHLQFMYAPHVFLLLSSLSCTYPASLHCARDCCTAVGELTEHGVGGVWGPVNKQVTSLAALQLNHALQVLAATVKRHLHAAHPSTIFRRLLGTSPQHTVLWARQHSEGRWVGVGCSQEAVDVSCTCAHGTALHQPGMPAQLPPTLRERTAWSCRLLVAFDMATSGGLMAAALQLAMSSSSDKQALQLHDST
jgi:hypothetical protein